MKILLDGRVGGVIEDYIRRQSFRRRNIETVEGALGTAREQDVKALNHTLVRV
jgi:hypothetical protein